MKILSIEGGGTTLKVTLVRNGEVLQRATFSKGTNLSAISEKQLEETIAEVAGWSGEVDEIRAAFSGAGSEERKKILLAVLNKCFPNAKIRIFTDAEAALWACYEGKPVTVVIAGTGSIVMGIDSSKNIFRAGGWGHLFDDEGGGFSIVCKLIRQALNYRDELIDYDPIFDQLLSFYGAKKIEDLVELQRYNDFKQKIASFTKHMKLTPLSKKIIEEEIEVLAKRTCHIISKVNSKKLYVHGGMFSMDYFYQNFADHFKNIETRKIERDIDLLLAVKSHFLLGSY